MKMSFQTYYQNTFQSHLQEFYNSIPDDMRHHNHQTFYDENKTFTIQVDKLSNHGRGTNIEHLKFLSPEDKIHFSISLFLTILTDQVCYTYFNSIYSRFRSLTNYPKLTGTCLTMCHINAHPTEIFQHIDTELDWNYRDISMIEIKNIFNESKDFMKQEILSFFKNHLNEIDGETFWKKCEEELKF
jgi:hypothetical protein